MKGFLIIFGIIVVILLTFVIVCCIYASSAADDYMEKITKEFGDDSEKVHREEE